MHIDTSIKAPIARVNSVALNSSDETLSADELRQRACSELLRQRAIATGLLPEDDAPGEGGVLSEEASRAIETLLEQNLVIPDPTEDECRRHHAAHQSFYVTGEQVNARHILFAVTQGVDVVKLRNRAETTLLDVRCHDGSDGQGDLGADGKRGKQCLGHRHCHGADRRGRQAWAGGHPGHRHGDGRYQ